MFTEGYTAYSGTDIGRAGGELNPNKTHASRNFVTGIAAKGATGAAYAQTILNTSTLSSVILAEEGGRRAESKRPTRKSSRRSYETVKPPLLTGDKDTRVNSA